MTLWENNIENEHKNDKFAPAKQLRTACDSHRPEAFVSREWHWQCVHSNTIFGLKFLPDTQRQRRVWCTRRTSTTRQIPQHSERARRLCVFIYSVAVAAHTSTSITYSHNTTHFTHQTKTNWILVLWVQCMFSYWYKRTDKRVFYL